MDAVKVIKKSGAPGAVPAVTAYVDEPLLPKVSAEDSGKVIGVDENGGLDAITIPVPEGKPLYLHQLRINMQSTIGTSIPFHLYCDVPDAFTWSTLETFLTNVLELSNSPRWDADSDDFTLTSGVLKIAHHPQIRYVNDAFSGIAEIYTFDSGTWTKESKTSTNLSVSLDKVSRII